MYPWQIGEIQEHWDQRVESVPEGRLVETFAEAGMGASMIDFLVPLYAAANGATFFDGAFRILPLDGFKEHGMPSLLAWDDPRGWKQFEESKANDTFYFCANGFGDLFGIPVTPQLEIINDRIGMLWVERHEYQEAGVAWSTFFPRCFSDPKFANYFTRLPAYQFIANVLGKPAPWRCFSSNVPQILGGPNTVENVSIQSLPVHVSFTMQMLKHWKEKGLTPGVKVEMVDLYDKQGNLLRGS